MTLREKLQSTAMWFSTFVSPMEEETYTSRQRHLREEDTRLRDLFHCARIQGHYSPIGYGEEDVEDSQIACAATTDFVNMSLCRTNW